jgi:phosphatidylserine decarboxylase
VLPAAFALWFFRDPTRHPPGACDAVLAPADGVLDDVREEPTSPFFPGPALRLGIFLSLLDVHVNRAPFAAHARRFEYRPGARRATYRVGELDDNEQHLTWFEHARDSGLVAVVRQIAGPAARRVCNWLRPDQAVSAGERFGLIKFGSRTEVWLPLRPDLRLLARRGQRVRAGETVLAEITAIANTVAVRTSCAAKDPAP